MGANSLTPSCPGDTDTQTCDNLRSDLPAFRVAAERFNKQNPGLELNSTDIHELMCKSRSIVAGLTLTIYSHVGI